MKPELTVGEFSRITHLSVKTLRHYHEVGLLEPDNVDASTGYRHYSLDQVSTAQVIRRLRDLEMPVAEVKAVIESSDASDRNRLIADHLARLEAKLAETHAAVESLRDLVGRSPSPLDIQYRSVGAQNVIGIRGTIERSDVLSWWQGALGELRGVIGAQGLTRTGPFGGLFDSALYQHENGEAIVFAPVEGGNRPVGRVTSFIVPPAELAIAVHRGPLSDADVTYGRLGSYAAGHELSVDGPLREYYLFDPLDGADQARWVTEIGWPIFRADRAG